MATRHMKVISTSVFQDQYDLAIKEHEQKLNNFVNYGYDMDNEQYDKFQFKEPMSVTREICSHSTAAFQTNNYNYKIITTLYVEDEPITDEYKG